MKNKGTNGKYKLHSEKGNIRKKFEFLSSAHVFFFNGAASRSGTLFPLNV